MTSDRPDNLLVTRTVLRLNARSRLPRIPFVRLILMHQKNKVLVCGALFVTVRVAKY